MSDQIGRILEKEEILRLQKEKLNENPGHEKEDIESIRKWIKQQPHLKNYGKTDDNFILSYLRGCKFSYEKTKKKIDMWHAMRAHCPEYYTEWDPLEKKNNEILSHGQVVPLAGYDKHGRKVVIDISSKMSLEVASLEERQRVAMMAMDMAFLKPDEQASVTGIVYICDTEGAGAKLAKAVTPSFLKKLTVIYQDSYPSNPKQAFMFNLHPVIDGLCRLAMSFSNKKMQERTKFYSKDTDYSFLHEALGKDVLPKEYGGTNGTLQMHVDNLKNVMVENRKWLMEQTKYRSEENKRDVKRTYSDIFGMEGSFRQLEFD